MLLLCLTVSRVINVSHSLHSKEPFSRLNLLFRAFLRVILRSLINRKRESEEEKRRQQRDGRKSRRKDEQERKSR